MLIKVAYHLICAIIGWYFGTWSRNMLERAKWLFAGSEDARKTFILDK